MPVFLKSNEGASFPVEKKVISHFEMVSKKLGHGRRWCRNGNRTIEVDLDSTSLERAIQWATHHKDDSSETREAMKSGEGITQWDQDFFGNSDSVSALLNAALKLDAPCLMQLGCKYLVDLLKDKTPEQIREMFHLENDFTPDEIEEMRQEDELANWFRMIM